MSYMSYFYDDIAKMAISAEAIIGLVALFVTCPPSALLIYSWAIRRQRSNQEIGTTPQGLVRVVRLGKVLTFV